MYGEMKIGKDEMIVFNTTCMGASHLKSGKPCQDYSRSWKSDDGAVCVSIVCDGHGGDTYVRSDKGAELAAEIALRNIVEFIKVTPVKLFLDKSARITARPEDKDFFSDVVRTGKNEDFGESQMNQKRQDEEFYSSVKDVVEQDSVITNLFARIYVQWINAISEDAARNPFTEAEESLLKDMRIAKAYGTTLMAFVRTPLYWFAFHIGDGKMLACDSSLNWSEPVPWDCNCFLNVTTSLCERNPLHSFRYAFSGKGDFPAAVMMGSDGIDDTWLTFDKLSDFYNKVLSIFTDEGEEEAVKQLGDYLPKLSAKGSRDDMSVAGIIDLEAVRRGVRICQIRQQKAELLKDTDKRKDEISKLEQTDRELTAQISDLEAEVESMDGVRMESWNELKQQYLKDAEAKWLEQLQLRAAKMEEHNDEALKTIREADE